MLSINFKLYAVNTKKISNNLNINAEDQKVIKI